MQIQKLKEFARHTRNHFFPSYQLESQNVIWPFRQITCAGIPIKEKIIAVSGPMRTDAEQKQMDIYVESGYYFIGISSYQNFPQKISNPYDYQQTRDFDFFAAYGDRCIGWLHCHRDPENYLPNDLPRALISESDFTNHRRITPVLADDKSNDNGKAYDFLYNCNTGNWNEYCRNWPLAKECIELATKKHGLSVLITGKEDADDFNDNPLVTCLKRQNWYWFLARLSSARFLLLPNIYDASPRIIAEAMCLDVPVIMNRKIIGGWKYINPRTGVFFETADEFDKILPEILKSTRFAPRKYFGRHYGHRNAGRSLYKFLKRLRSTRSFADIPCRSKADQCAISENTRRVIDKIQSNPVDPVPKVFFMVHSHVPKNEYCEAIYNSWGGRVDNIVFFTNKKRASYPVVNLKFGGAELRKNLWKKTIEIYKYTYKHYRNEFDWFMFCDDDVFLILNNLYAYLQSKEISDRHNNQEPLYIGRRFQRPEDDFVYHSGGAGYLLNRYALEVLIQMIPDSEPEFQYFADDLMVGKALHRGGVAAFDTRDERGAERFHPFTPDSHYDFRTKNAPDDWFPAYTKNFDLIEGIAGISEESISFHYITPEMMYTLDKELNE